MSEKSILELAKEHQIACYMGKHKLMKGGKSKNYRYISVNCILCGRKMDAPEFENPPYYCYKCDPEAEAMLRDSCWTNQTPPENLERDKRIKEFEDYYNGKPYTGKR